MTYAEEMALGGSEAETEMGESFTYDAGATAFRGLFSDEDPNLVFLSTGKNTQRALIVDASATQFAAITPTPVVPVSGKKIVYSGDGKTYMVRLVFPITGGLLRFHIYQL